MCKSCQKKRNMKLYVPERSSILRQTGAVKRSYRERLSDLYNRIKTRSTKAEVPSRNDKSNWKKSTVEALCKPNISLFDDLSFKIRQENDEARNEKPSRQDLFEAYQDLCTPREKDHEDEDKNILSAVPKYQNMNPFMASVLIDLFNNEPEFQSTYKLLKEEAGETAQVPKDEASTTNKDEEVTYELGKSVSTGAFNMKVLELLGEGSQAVIYKVQKGSETYAAKISQKEAYTKMIMQEYELISSVTHTNILSVYESIPNGFLMDVLPDNLLTYIPENFDTKSLLLPFRDTITIGILKAVSHLHSNGIAHLDIKPENILLTAGGQPKLADFGLSLRYRDVAGRPRFLKGMRGSLAYLSPEVLSGKEQNSMTPLDVWAVGVVMYALFTGGRVPFGNISAKDVYEHQMEGPITIPHKMKVVVQNDLSFANYFSVVYQLLTLQPKMRPSAQSALRMIELLT